jgi:hypothetical protein
MWLGFAKIIEKVCIWRHCEWPATDIPIAENAWCINNADSRSSKWVHWLSKSQSPNRITTYYGCQHKVEFDNRVAWPSLPITRIHLQVAYESKIQSITANLDYTGWMDHSQVRHGSVKANPILDSVDVEMAYSYSALCHHCLQWHVWSHGWHYASIG